MAEYFRDVKKKTFLLFIDNIFRFAKPDPKFSALLGRIAICCGISTYLVILKVGELQERITSTKQGSITRYRAVYVRLY